MEMEKHKTEKDKGTKVKWKKHLKLGGKKKSQKEHEAISSSDPDLTAIGEEQNRKLCALESYVKDLQNEIASLKAEVVLYEEKIQGQNKATDTDDQESETANKEGKVPADYLNVVFQSTEYHEDQLKSMESEIASLKDMLKTSEQAASSKSKECEELSESLDKATNNLKVMESEIASLRDRLKTSEQNASSKSKECEELKKGLDKANNKLITAEKQVLEMVGSGKETVTQEIIERMKADYEAAVEEERQKNKALNEKLQAGMTRNDNGKENVTPSCFPCFRIGCCRRVHESAPNESDHLIPK